MQCQKRSTYYSFYYLLLGTPYPIGNATNRINQNECNMIQHKKYNFFSIIYPTFLTISERTYAWDQISHIKATQLPNKWNEYIDLSSESLSAKRPRFEQGMVTLFLKDHE
jgi:hypothetical protein